MDKYFSKAILISISSHSSCLWKCHVTKRILLHQRNFQTQTALCLELYKQQLLQQLMWQFPSWSQLAASLHQLPSDIINTCSTLEALGSCKLRSRAATLIIWGLALTFNVRVGIHKHIIHYVTNIRKFSPSKMSHYMVLCTSCCGMKAAGSQEYRGFSSILLLRQYRKIPFLLSGCSWNI